MVIVSFVLILLMLLIGCRLADIALIALN